MKQTFSFRRFGMLARKHYTDNRINYIAGLGGYLMLLLLGLYGALREEKPSLAMFESVIYFATFFLPIAVAKISFTPYIHTNRQLMAFTLPATTSEKYLFGVVNTLLVSALALVGLEVAASLVAPHVHSYNLALNIEDYYTTGRWFAGFGEIWVIVLLFASVTILACTMARKGSVAVPMFATIAALTLFYSLPTILINGNGWSVSTLEIPNFITTFNNHIDCGNTILECTTTALMQPLWWYNMILPVILLVAAGFKFREYETK